MSPQTTLILNSFLGAVVIVAGLIVSRWVTRKQDALFAASTVEGAVLREKCQIRIEFVDCPGVAFVVGDTLVLRGVLMAERRLRLSQIKLKKETAGTGKYYWWGKRLFHLDVPGVSELVIGVKNPEPWRQLFRGTVQA
jgi:hypothetical protein